MLNAPPSTPLQGIVRTQCRRQLRLGQFRREIFAWIDETVRLELVLLVVERPVAAAERDQLGVAAALDDLPAFQHEDLIGAADRREAMRDDEGRAPMAQ